MSSNTDSASSKNTLSADVEIIGSIQSKTDLSIDGKVEGNITSRGVLTIGSNAEIKGEIHTKSAIIHGKVHASVAAADRCELKTGSQLFGDLQAARLVIEEGSTFVGKSEVSPAGSAAKPA